ncbi:MAG: hypothetical protein IID34_11260, partial [Planctomycetes bacterium]|nr:hypothetical protein [Planctomycetota bacterium]
MPFSRVQWCVLALASGILLSPGSGVLGAIIYVDADATGTNDGSTWEDAFADLQDALAVAE